LHLVITSKYLYVMAATDIDPGTPCFEAIHYLDEAMRDSLPDGVDYFVLGGIPSSAILHPDTEFDFTKETIGTTAEASDSTIRDNGTLRDVDILVARPVGKKEGERLVEQVEKATGGALEVSVFGFELHSAADDNPTRLRRSLKEWTSLRTIDDDGIIRHELYPVSVAVNPDSYRPWTLSVPELGTTVSVFSPPGHELAYESRSISGIRAKDREKVSKLRDVIESYDEFIKAIEEGDFKEWQRFVEALQQMRDGTLFHFDEERLPTGHLALAVFDAKFRALTALEGSDRIVRWAQGGTLQKLLKPFVGAK